MKNKILPFLICLFPISLTAQEQCNNNNYINQVEYIPSHLGEIDLNKTNFSIVDYNNDCIRIMLSALKANEIKILTPEKIIFEKTNPDFVPTIPIIFMSHIKDIQSVKYKKFSEKMVHIQNVKDSIVYSGEIYEFVDGAIPPTKDDIKRKKEFEKKVLSGEIDPETSTGSGATANVMDYVNIPLETGRYEIYMTFYGIESNHVFVDVEFKD